MREIVTIQVGGFANFVGSHFWNFQDELLGLAEDPQSDLVFQKQCINTDVLYRTGETPKGIPTYTPRLVSIDLPGSLGTMSSHGTMYNEILGEPSAVATWNGKVSSHVAEPHKRNLFLQSLDKEGQEEVALAPSAVTGLGRNDHHRRIHDEEIVQSLETGVNSWTDFSKVHYHPQSLYELNGLWTSALEFDTYGAGKDVFSEGFRGEDMSERLRFFVEECDHIQGLQLIVDDSGGFSGLAADFMEHIADEYSNTPVMLYTVKSPVSFLNTGSRKNIVARHLHDAISFSKLSSFCKLIVPVGLPSLSRSKAPAHLLVEDEKPYHSSAIYAAALHALSLPFRMDLPGPSSGYEYSSGVSDFNAVIQMLVSQGKQNMVAILDSSMPAPSLPGKTDKQPLLSSLQTLTSETAEGSEDLFALEHLSIHGVLGSGDSYALVSEVKDAVQTDYENFILKPMFTHLSVSCCPLPIPLPFPSIFSNCVGQRGQILESPISGSRSRGSLDIHSVPVAARLRSSIAILPFLESRMKNLRRFGIDRGALGGQLLRTWGFGEEELADMGEMLSNMVNNVDTRTPESSDSDD